MRLIDADILKNDHHMGDECDKCETKWRECQYDYIYSKMDFCTWIDYAPTIEAVKVVRCFECKYFIEHEQEFKDRWGSDWDGYCSYWNSHSTVFSNFCGFAQKANGEEKK